MILRMIVHVCVSLCKLMYLCLSVCVCACLCEFVCAGTRGSVSSERCLRVVWVCTCVGECVHGCVCVHLVVTFTKVSEGLCVRLFLTHVSVRVCGVSPTRSLADRRMYLSSDMYMNICIWGVCVCMCVCLCVSVCVGICVCLCALSVCVCVRVSVSFFVCFSIPCVYVWCVQSICIS